MKIKEHIILAFTNPLGNLLAAANLAMLALGHGLFHSFHGFGKLANDLSMPAALTSFALVGSVDSRPYSPTHGLSAMDLHRLAGTHYRAAASAYAKLNHF